MNNGRIHHIDVWRFVAISMVIVCHIVGNSHPWYWDTLPGIVWRLKPLGTVGVQIFFCISGFVICRGLIREAEISFSVNMAAFYRRRAYRLLPPLAAYMIGVMVLVSIGVFDVALSQFLQAAAFLCNLHSLGKCGWVLGHTWSLAYEEQFYLVFPLLFVLLNLTSNRSRLLKIGAGLLALGLISGLSGNFAVWTYIGHFLCMFIGCACALYWDKVGPTLQNFPLPVWLTSVMLIPGLSMFAMPTVVQEMLYPIVLPPLICVAVFGTPNRGLIAKYFFANPVLAYLGRISYGIYLLQQLATWDYGFASPLPTYVLVVATVVVAHYSYKYFELPLIKRGSAGSSQKKMRSSVRSTVDLDAADQAPLNGVIPPKA